MPGIRSINEGKGQRVKTSRKHVVTRGWDIAGVFVSNDSGCKTCCLKGDTLCEGVAVIAPESLCALPPFRGILRSAFARRVCHANTRTKCRSREDTRIQKRLVDVVTKLTLDARPWGIAAEGLCRAGWILGPRKDREQQNSKT